MYGSYNPQFNIERLKRQKEEIEQLINNYQTIQQPQQQPVTNIINTNSSQIDFEARYLNENEKAEEILVQRKTAFISLKNKQLSIKDINGDITTYEIVMPKDEKDIRIEELERQVQELKGMIKGNEHAKYVKPNNEIWKSDANDYGNDESKPKEPSTGTLKETERGTVPSNSRLLQQEQHK